MERFIGILIEHYAGFMPLWLSPVQAIVLNIADAHSDYAREVTESLRQNNIRCNSDLRNEKITYKIREHSIQRVSYILVVGDREKETSQVSVRNQKGENLGSMSLDALLKNLNKEISDKS